MAKLTLRLKDELYHELKRRAEKREIRTEDYVIKSLRWHLKQVKKFEMPSTVQKGPE